MPFFVFHEFGLFRYRGVVVVVVVVVVIVVVVVHPGRAIVRTHEKQKWPWNGLRNAPSTSRYHHFRGNLNTNPFLTLPRARNRLQISFEIDWPMLDPNFQTISLPRNPVIIWPGMICYNPTWNDLLEYYLEWSVIILPGMICCNLAVPGLFIII